MFAELKFQVIAAENREGIDFSVHFIVCGWPCLVGNCLFSHLMQYSRLIQQLSLQTTIVPKVR